ncbi:MAG: diguanylate cyclase [Bdellovibrio sp.]
MKKWMQKLIDQLELDWKSSPSGQEPTGASPLADFSEEKATLLYVIDTFARNLIETEALPARKVRETFDEFAKEIIQADRDKLEKVLFRFRQYFNSHRLEESSYVQKTFDDFRGIIWDFVDQLSEDLVLENQSDLEMQQHLTKLKDAVEANSIDSLKTHSRHFIDSYTEFQTKKDRRRMARMDHVRKNLDTVKKQLTEANTSMRQDHLTKAFNRKSFEEQAKNARNLHSLYKKHCSLIILDIDFFKKINDNYGHDMGDFVLQECVRTLKGIFSRDVDCVARIGGEEFAILLPDHQIEHAVHKAQAALQKIRSEKYLNGELVLQFTVSMGVAELLQGETVEQWMKRADVALYESKQTGRNKYTVAAGHPPKKNVA